MRKIILSNEQIKEICKRIGAELTKKFANNKKPPIFIGIMKGGIPFMQDLIVNVDVPLMTDYIQIRSWSGLGSTGSVTMVRDVSGNIEGRNIVFVEDIIDSGLSMNYLIDYFKTTHKPASITVVSLLNKEEARKTPVQIDYYGTLVGNEFLMGYGLDYYELYRDTDYVFVPDMDEVASWDKIIENLKG